MADSAKPSEKSKYNLFQNTGFMVKLAWGHKKSVLFFCVGAAALAVVTNVIGLFISPIILGEIESSLPLSRLITTIILFVVSLMVVYAAQAYLATVSRSNNIHLMALLLAKIQEKFMKTSYPNTEEQAFLKKVDKAKTSVISNDN
ncbi:MAG: hypothetical protein LBS21_10270 [Clostridiales bacterium]|nr:hypothetical protein [Clostridiales bacterium]